jgi:hypothetical protein
VHHSFEQDTHGAQTFLVFGTISKQGFKARRRRFADQGRSLDIVAEAEIIADVKKYGCCSQLTLE